MLVGPKILHFVNTSWSGFKMFIPHTYNIKSSSWSSKLQMSSKRDLEVCVWVWSISWSKNRVVSCNPSRLYKSVYMMGF